MAGASRSMVLDYHFRRPLVKFGHFLLFLASLFTLVAYRSRNKERIQADGWVACLSADIPKALRRRFRAARRAWKRGAKRARRAARLSRSHDEYDMDDDDIWADEIRQSGSGSFEMEPRTPSRKKRGKSRDKSREPKEQEPEW